MSNLLLVPQAAVSHVQPNPNTIRLLTAAEIRKDHGDPTVLINNAGVAFSSPLSIGALTLGRYQMTVTTSRGKGEPVDVLGTKALC